jgi:hypothetical protein
MRKQQRANEEDNKGKNPKTHGGLVDLFSCSFVKI